MIDHPSNEALQAYLDGELSMREGDELDAHLEICATCAEELEHLRTLFLVIESVAEEELETDLSPAVVDAIRPRLPSLAIGELAVLGALALALVIWLGGGELQRRVEASAARLIDRFESSWVLFEQTLIDTLGQIPSLPQVDFDELAESAGTALTSPSILWAVVGSAFALWVLGNGLILRLGKDENA